MKNYLPVICCFLLAAAFSGGLSAQTMEGMASFYADKFDGKSTSTGEIFRQEGYMAASKELPWGTIVEVTNISNGKKVQVRVNDCGPHARNRIIDLSKRAARELGFIKQGEAMVRLRVVRTSNAGPNCARGAWAKALREAGKPIPPPPGPWKPEDTAGATGQVTPPGPTVAPSPAGPQAPAGVIQGMASYYADRFNGRPTSTGETYDASDFTAASKAFPYNTLLEVSNAASGAKVTVRVNDCGPHTPERILDLSKAAATQIGVTRVGVASVYVRVIQLGTDGPTCNRKDWAAKAPEAAGPQVYEPSGPPPAALNEYNFPEAYYVQLGAFSSPASAELMTRRAVASGYAYAHYSYDPQSGLYTTTIRRFYDQSSGKQVQRQLAKDGFGKTALKKARTPGELTTDGGGKVAAAGVAPDELTITNAYLVQLGSFASMSSAEELAREARAAGYVDPHVYFNPESKLHTTILYTYYDEPTAKVVQAQLRRDGFATTSLTEEFTFGTVASEPVSKEGTTAAAAPTAYGNGATPGSIPAYTLQVGAFKDQEAAYAQADKLAAAGYVDGGVYTNPETGLYSTVLWTVYNRVTAKTIQQQLEDDGFGASLKKTEELPQNIKTSPQSKGETAMAPATYATPASAPKTYDADAILFGVQVGSYATKAGAKEAKKQLEAGGFTEVYDAKVGKMTRVFAGKFYFPNQAEELKGRLREAGFAGAAVRRVQ